MPNWTEQQQQVIDDQSHSLLVAAAAGSGKTAVMVEKVLTLIRQNCQIDDEQQWHSLTRLLMVTFTKAAAGEMRQKLSRALNEELQNDPEHSEVYLRAIDDLESAQVSTIHSFCQRVLKENFHAAGIDPNARVASNVPPQMFEDAYRDAFNELVKEKNEQFIYLTRCYPRHHALLEIVKQLYKFLMSLPEPFGWMRSHIQRMTSVPFEEHPWMNEILYELQREKEGISQLVKKIDDMFNSPFAQEKLEKQWAKDCVQIEAVMDALSSSYNSAKKAAASFKLDNAPRTSVSSEEDKEWKELFAEGRKNIKTRVEKIAKITAQDQAGFEKNMQKMAYLLEGLLAITEKTHENYMRTKNENRLLEFSDLEQLTVKMLADPIYRAEMQEKYDYIFVDECQDNTAVQDEIFQRLKGTNAHLFMVGDVKQSIYRFRLADPMLFRDRMLSYLKTDTDEGRCIRLNKNFRSTENVLEATNEVFTYAMRADVTELDYKGEELHHGRKEADDHKDAPVDVHLVLLEEGKQEDIRNAEWQRIAEIIKELKEQSFFDGKEERFYQYRDIVILMRSVKDRGAQLAEVLERNNIPVYMDAKEEFYNLPEIHAFHCLLQVIDNPMDDLSLVIALKNAPFVMNEAEFAEIRREHMSAPSFFQAFEEHAAGENVLNQKCKAVLEQLSDWRFRAQMMGLHDFVDQLLHESGQWAMCATKQNGAARQANLRMMVEKASDYEHLFPDGLHGFLQAIQEEIAQADSTGAMILGENENIVRIMTMHKSKGMEYPAVILANLANEFRSETDSTIMYHNELGLWMEVIDPDHSMVQRHWQSVLGNRKTREAKAEMTRLLYVAMTRAREKLILTAATTLDDAGGERWEKEPGSYSVSSAKCMLDWVMQPLYQRFRYEVNPGNSYRDDRWQLFFETQPEQIPEEEKKTPIQVVTEARQEAANEPEENALAFWDEKIEMSYEPLKTSVTSLITHRAGENHMPQEGEEEDAETKREQVVMPLRISDVAAVPRFMAEKKSSGAAWGTLMHKLLSLAELDKLRDKKPIEIREELEAEAKAWLEKGLLSDEEYQLIRLDKLTQYYMSPLGKRVLAAQTVKREWAFNLLLDKEKGIILQGVIDCCVKENGGWLLIDYKTDRITSEEEFVQKHTQQLNYYRVALETITGMPVHEIYLYALSTNQAYAVEKIDVG